MMIFFTQSGTLIIKASLVSQTCVGVVVGVGVDVTVSVACEDTCVAVTSLEG